MWWPLFDLRIRTADLDLRPLTEADLDQLAGLLPEEVEQDPAATRYDIDPAVGRGVVVHQKYWRDQGTWTPQAWRLTFAVRYDGELVGTQELEGNDFLDLRTVDSSSFLAPAARGRGWGKQMRAAVLTLGFGPLEARAAISSAWHDNHASLGVSRALGYRDNGESLMRSGDRLDTLVHLRLVRSDWDASAHAAGITVTGWDRARPLFGM